MLRITSRWPYLAGVAMLLLIALLFHRQIVGYVLHELPFSGRDFEPAAWAAATQCSSNVECAEKDFACSRGPMYADLEKNHLRLGTSKKSVMTLLGPGIGSERKPACIDYDLGMCSGFKMDPDYLRVCFDADEKVVDVLHYQS